MSITFDTQTLIGKVRVLAEDREGAFFSDEIITDVFLGMNSDSVRLAAADALDAIANNKVLLLLKLTLTGGLATDGPAVAESLRKGAMLLRQAELGLYDPSGMFDIIETAWDQRSYDDILWNSLLRSGA